MYHTETITVRNDAQWMCDNVYTVCTAVEPITASEVLLLLIGRDWQVTSSARVSDSASLSKRTILQ